MKKVQMFYSMQIYGLNGNRRDKMDIIFGILNAINMGGCKKTWIMYYANLDWKVFKRYMEFLERHGFVEKDGNEGFVLTNKGNALLEKLNEVKDILNVGPEHA
ncbi:winged helix-turn-helix domain-containing protein [Methanothermococcus okinawensis]|uniref:ArnR1-like winged helix-turn-helix domain-containing protein n=1 Tax=Methanothermococcus okinawensis (strain DSM 14208 / JCM 11175 / IH1) TaxID=647113 RepID=F8ALQ0_METOI|nr:winged helix-turn-helix domain-containing protein [Methanothermococcus okinawensis]AEH06598.1 hypothetical protein Metok_0618 [Methanothermococcus okinawensis IH1]